MSVSECDTSMMVDLEFHEKVKTRRGKEGGKIQCWQG